jgi:hypothetical protein
VAVWAPDHVLLNDHKKVRELASHMILYHEYPFMVVEHVLFNKFMRANTL